MCFIDFIIVTAIEKFHGENKLSMYVYLTPASCDQLN